MKKYIIFIILAATTLLGAVSCDSEKEVGLDGSVDDRINKLIDTYVDDLIKAEHGWMVSINTINGYYRFWMEFKDNDVVTMLSDNPKYPADATKLRSSTYVFRALQRPTLSFDTYNYISMLNDPDNGISGGSKNKGLVTDFEFEVVRYTDGIFYMMGRFNKVEAIFKPASALDKEGALAGDMLKRIQTKLNDDGSSSAVQLRWENMYIHAQYEGTEIVVKVYDQRHTYQFWFNNSQNKGADGEGFYVAEVNGSNDITFPEPIKILNDVEIIGLRYDPTAEWVGGSFNYTDGNFKAFYARDAKGKEFEIDVTVKETPPTFPITNVFGMLGSGKMFDGAYCPSGLVSAIPSNHKKTQDALKLSQKYMFIMGPNIGQFNIISDFSPHYYFSHNTREGRDYFNIYFAPKGFGFDFSNGTQDLSAVTTYDTALYEFPATIEQGTDFVFTTSTVPTRDKGARKYEEELNITKDLITMFKGETFTIKWSNVKLNSGLIIDFAPEKQNDFLPPAIMYTR